VSNILNSTHSHPANKRIVPGRSTYTFAFWETRNLWSYHSLPYLIEFRPNLPLNTRTAYHTATLLRRARSLTTPITFRSIRSRNRRWICEHNQRCAVNAWIWQPCRNYDIHSFEHVHIRAFAALGAVEADHLANEDVFILPVHIFDARRAPTSLRPESTLFRAPSS